MKPLILLIAFCLTTSLQTTNITFLVLYKMSLKSAGLLRSITLDDQKNVTDLLTEINNKTPQQLNTYPITTCRLYTLMASNNINSTDLLDQNLQNVLISQLTQQYNKIFVNW